jgi:hypothetical protein
VLTHLVEPLFRYSRTVRYGIRYGGTVNSKVYVMKSPAPERVRLRRPKGSGQYPVIPVRLSPEIVEVIDKLAAKAKSSRSGYIRGLIEAGLKRRPKA